LHIQQQPWQLEPPPAPLPRAGVLGCLVISTHSQSGLANALPNRCHCHFGCHCRLTKQEWRRNGKERSSPLLVFFYLGGNECSREGGRGRREKKKRV
jgi:hypothetical protein